MSRRADHSLWLAIFLLSVVLLLVSGTPSWAANLQVLPNGQVVVTGGAAPSSSTVPVDGMLRGPNSQAQVTSVAWPYEADGYVANTGDRLVAFSVELTEPSSDGGPFGSGGPTLTLIVDGSPQSLDTTVIANGVGNSSGSTGSGTESYVASVPNDTHDVDLSMSDSSFTQTLSLWTLERTTPAPGVLYGGPDGLGIEDQLGLTRQVLIRDPSGATSMAAVLVSSATLAAFNPDTTITQAAPPGHAYLVLSMQADNTAGVMGGNYLTEIPPIPASAVRFTSRTGRRYEATRSNVIGDSTDVSAQDDGLLDATYAFLVPSSTRGGIVSIGPVTTSGDTYDGYLNSDPPETLQLEGPVRFSVGFPALSTPVRQPTPPWVNEPVPSTGLPGHAGPASGGLPAGIALVGLAARS